MMASKPTRVDLPNGQTVWWRDRGDWHEYYREAKETKDGWKCSGRVTGASTISKALDLSAEGLMGWAAKLEAHGACELYAATPSEEREWLLDGGGDRLHRALAEAGYDWKSVRERRADEGSTVHERIFAALARGERPSLSEINDAERPYGQAAFRFWLDHDPEPIAVEQVVYSSEPEFAGRFDLLARVDGEVVLYDAKTTKAPDDGRERFVNVGHHGQLAGYVHACATSGFEPADRAVLVYLLDDGTYELEGCEADPEDFFAALADYNVSKGIAKRVRAQRKATREAVPA